MNKCINASEEIERDPFQAYSRLRKSSRLAPHRVQGIIQRMAAPLFLPSSGLEGVEDGLREVVLWYLRALPDEMDLGHLLSIARHLGCKDLASSVEEAMPYDGLSRKNAKSKSTENKWELLK
jgi:hypothetical protein